MISTLAKITLFSFLFLLLIPDLTFSETKTFIKEYTYQASEDDSRNSSRVLALREVKRLLLEELGTYLESVTEVQNFQLTQDQITMLTAGIIQTEIVDEKWDGRTYWLRSKIVADSSEVIRSIDVLRKDRAKKKELEDMRQRSEELQKEIERLRKELAGTKGKEKQENTAAYNKSIEDLSAIEWFEKGYSFVVSGNFNRAIDAFSKAIKLDQKDAGAYVNRGIAYGNVGNDKQAINDFDKAIQLDQKYAKAYYNRGVAYGKLDNYEQAIKDYDKAIELDQQYAMAYNNRGVTYRNLGNYNRAIKDYDKAIELDQKSAGAYVNRGNAYGALGKHKQAIKDYNKAIELDPKYVDAYAVRGIAYGNLGNYKQAIKDYDKAIDLDPKDAAAYVNRGGTYYKRGKHKQAIKDFKMAAGLGNKKAQNYLRGQRIDWIPLNSPNEGEKVHLQQHTQNQESINKTAAATSAELTWKNAQQDFFRENPDYVNDKVLNKAFVIVVNELITKPESAQMTDRQVFLAAKLIVDKARQKHETTAPDPSQQYGEMKGIVLKNGNVIEGQILQMDAHKVKIRTKDGKTSSYSFENEIQSFIKNEQHPTKWDD